MKYSKNALTLVEIMVSLMILSFVFISAFEALSYIWIWKIRLIESSQIEKEAFFVSERLIDLIKKWGTIDYEEYWNRTAIWSTTFRNWYFHNVSAFWNAWMMYYCLSWNGNEMPANGCLTGYNRTRSSIAINNYNWQQQRFWQYRLQYIDHNSDANDDYWDVSRTLPNYTNFIWDDDDLFLWQGPDAFVSWEDAWELYLINATWDERTFFRWHFELDSDAPDGEDCPSTVWSKSLTWSWCLWTIQMLKLVWRDYWNNHDPLTEDWDWSQWDGMIDTWILHPDFTSWSSEIVIDTSNANNYWQNIFSNRIHVSKAEFYLYPNQDLDYAWAVSSTDRPDLQVSPYLQLRVRLEPSWRERRKIRWTIPVVDIATTINLSSVDIF